MQTGSSVVSHRVQISGHGEMFYALAIKVRRPNIYKNVYENIFFIIFKNIYLGMNYTEEFLKNY